MDIIRAAIDKPVAVLVGVILIVLFGLIALSSLPYQLSPTVTEPEITVTTRWTGATPYEMEREIVEEQEKVLKGIPRLTTMESTAYNAYSEITLTFEIGTNVDDALLRVSNKMNEVPDYPDNVDKPVISATGSSASPVIWMILKPVEGEEGKDTRPINTYGTYFENEVRQHLERVKGVADLFIFGGTERQMHVVVDPDKLSAYGLTIEQIVDVMESENSNTSAGVLGVGRRDYRIRTVGQFSSPEEIESIIITSSGQRRITVGDVAKVGFGYEKLQDSMMHNGARGMVCGIKPETGANILEMTDAMEEVVKGLNEGKLRDQGIYLDWTYDQRPYINGAIDLVTQNIMIGAVLAVIVLLTFLRSASSTFIVAVAIPISAVGCFIFLKFMDRTLNVVSLAGISFAVGMLVDNAIVVLENIDRHRRQLGKSPLRASHDGAKEVWGAVLASTATTVAVFLPVVFMEQEAGQLFKDIAIAVTSAILLSMLVSVWVIPTLATRLFSISDRRKLAKNGNGGGNGRKIPGARAFQAGNKAAGRLAGGIMSIVELSIRNWATRLITIGVLTALSVGLTIGLMPKMEYLPQGNRNLLLNIMIPPPGLSYEERQGIGEYLWDKIEPMVGKDEYNGLPGISEMFYVGADRIMLYGAISTQEERAGELVPFMFGLMNSIPGMFGVSLQAGVFQQDLGGGRSIDVDLSHSDMTRLVGGTGALFGALKQAIPDAQIRPIPSLEMLFPEVRLLPERDRLRSSSMTTEQLGVIMDVLMDGRIVGEFKQEGEKKIDLVVKAADERFATPEALYTAMVHTPEGRTLPVSSLATIQRTTGMNQIRHLERDRTITLQVTPPKSMPLEEAMEIIENGVVPKLAQGPLKGIDFKMSGAADKLTTARSALQWNFLLAVLITYLLMSALFENFIYPLVVMFTVPLAAGGGMAGLALENLFIRPQPLDILTMLGFIILVGVVVNNAILLVHQSLNNIRESGMEPREAVLESVRTRLRPVFMSATTSVFGMLPLAVAPGPGSELYSGLGSVVLGGLAFSTIFTVFVTPSMLMFFLGMEKGSMEKKRMEQALTQEQT